MQSSRIWHSKLRRIAVVGLATGSMYEAISGNHMSSTKMSFPFLAHVGKE
jgi:hypothetical protein